MRCTPRILAAIAAVAVVSYASVASAAIYQIDPNLSQITITGNIAGAIQLVPQTVGSNIVTFEGTIDADTDGSTDITFNSANADAQLQPLPQSPDAGGAAGMAPADAGLLIGPGLGDAALRDFVISVSGGPIALVGGLFDLTGLTLTISTGILDYNVPLAGGAGQADLAGTTANPTAGVGTVAGDTLTIPVDVQITLEVSEGPPPITGTVFLTGAIVAVVPEPGTIAMLGVGLVGLIAVGYRRARRS